MAKKAPLPAEEGNAGDWTKDPVTGRSCCGPQFMALVGEVATVIRGFQGVGKIDATGLSYAILESLATKHRLAPPLGANDDGLLPFHEAVRMGIQGAETREALSTFCWLLLRTRIPIHSVRGIREALWKRIKELPEVGSTRSYFIEEALRILEERLRVEQRRPT